MNAATFAWLGPAAGALITGLFLLAGQRYARRGQKQQDTGELALELAKQAIARTEVLERRDAWRQGVVAAWNAHNDALWSWIQGGMPPPPPPRLPALPEMPS